MRARYLLVLLCIAGCTTRSYQRPAAPGAASASDTRPDPAGRAAQLEAFDVAWQVLRDEYYDPSFNGLDWEAVRAEYRPRVARADDLGEARAALVEMLTRLDDPAVTLLPDDPLTRAGQVDPPLAGPEVGAADVAFGVPPFEVDVVGGKVLITRLTGPVADPRIRPGVEVVAVAGRVLTEVIAGDTSTSDARPGSGYAAASTVFGLLSGQRGTRVPVGFEAFDGQGFAADVQRVAPPGEEVRQAGLPPFPLELERRTLETPAGPVAYLRLGAFAAPGRLIPFVQQAVAEANRDAHAGVILDLRGNSGGPAALGLGVAGFFVDARGQSLGRQVLRGGALEYAINPRRPAYDGPLAVLIDGGTLSTAEIVAQGLKDLGRAQLFGTATGGGPLPGVVIGLPDGGLLRYATSAYVSPAGTRVQGVGVRPDQAVTRDRRSLDAGRDAVIDAAAAWVVEQARRDRAVNPKGRISA